MLKETGRLTAQMGEPVHRTTIAQTPTKLGFMEEWSEESHYFKKKKKPYDIPIGVCKKATCMEPNSGQSSKKTCSSMQETGQRP